MERTPLCIICRGYPGTTIRLSAPAITFFDLRKVAQAKTLAAAAGALGVGIGELQPTVYQIVGVIDNQAFEKLLTPLIRYDPNRP